MAHHWPPRYFRIGPAPNPFGRRPPLRRRRKPRSPLSCSSSVFTHLNLPALSFALLLTPRQLSHFSLTQRDPSKANHRKSTVSHVEVAMLLEPVLMSLDG